MEPTKISSQVFIDPVCLMKVTSGKKNLTFTYQMRTYYFCAESCLKSFEASPERYLKSTPSKRKKWWNRYLDRLNKFTGGKSPKCH